MLYIQRQIYLPALVVVHLHGSWLILFLLSRVQNIQFSYQLDQSNTVLEFCKPQLHMHRRLKANLYPVREGDGLRQNAFQRPEQVDYGPPIGMVYIHSQEDLILYELMYFGFRQQSTPPRDIAAILKSKKDALDLAYIARWKEILGSNS